MLRPRLLVVAGACALLVLLIVLVTGGFTIRAGPLYFAAHNWRGPLVGVLVAFGLLALDRSSFAAATSEVWRFIADHAPAAAVVIAASAAGAGVALGTYSASSSDASGYISEARLLGALRVADDEPIARRVPWPEATWAFAPLGYRPGTTIGELVPTYPPGLPLVIAPIQRGLGEMASFLVVPFLGALAVLATYALGAHLHSRPAGLIAAMLLATSPIFLFQLVQPMSDVVVTAWWSVSLLCALLPFRGAIVAAGIFAGLAVLTRPNLAPIAAFVAMAGIMARRDRIDRPAALRTGVAFLAGLTPALAAVALLQWRLYGSPLLSGYGSAGELFDIHNIAQNAALYAARMLRGEGGALTVAAFALVILTVRRAVPSDPPLVSVKPALILAASAIAVVSALYLPYAVFSEWSYLRFLLPSFPLLFVLIGALLATALARLPSEVRGVVLIVVLALAGSYNVVRAQDEQAFNLRRYESRYRLAGRYLRETLPRESVIVCVQESGSARYYVGVPVLRWDQMPVDLDAAIATLRTVGRYPVLLVEDWEAPELRRRFPESTLARLEWTPRAEFGDETRVHLFDPADRTTGRAWPTDRVH